jgi:hypothetical protein
MLEGVAMRERESVCVYVCHIESMKDERKGFAARVKCTLLEVLWTELKWPELRPWYAYLVYQGPGDRARVQCVNCTFGHHLVMQ